MIAGELRQDAAAFAGERFGFGTGDALRGS